MDYVVGSVAALISGNVTPNRPRKFKKALTPTKHQPSPNVTPKSEFVEDRSVFLSPTMQKKKAIVKKSPKRIFQNPDLDVTNEDEANKSVSSPKAGKVKKHLKDELDSTIPKTDEVLPSPKTPKNTSENVSASPKAKKTKVTCVDNTPELNENSPKKKKKKNSSENKDENIVEDENVLNEKESEKENVTTNVEPQTPKKKKKKSKSQVETEANIQSSDPSELNEVSNSNILEKNDKQKNKKKQNKNSQNEEQSIPAEDASATVEANTQSIKKKNKKKKKSKSDSKSDDNVVINPNAVTNKDTDSEHESDDQMDSENEEINKKALDPGPAEDSSDEEAEKPKHEPTKKEETVETEDEVKRTIFIGNVPFSSKCKKEIKKIFNQYGQIETVRIRTVPVKDARVTPKMAVIKKELHPDRSTVNVYVKFTDAASVEKALSANNTVLRDHHLRVSRSDSSGATHDPKCSIFVGNIPFAIEDETLRSKFEKCGEIESVRIIRDKKTNAGKGFGYVNFASKDGVELALALTEEDLTIKNRILRVKRCTQATQRKAFQPNNKQMNSNQWQNQNFQKSNYGRQDVNNFKKGRYDKSDDKNEGAYRRVMNKRKSQDGGEGPPNKRQNLNQPHKEKKERKEFVGMTAEKKKKHKFDKGQKKKKVLSEILTKK